MLLAKLLSDIIVKIKILRARYQNLGRLRIFRGLSRRQSLKNNLIIAGVSRAGKSTIANRLSKAFGYQHVSMDSINAGFEKAFPELGIDTHAADSNSEEWAKLSAKIAPFIRAMLDSGEYDEFKPGMVLDVAQLMPGDYVKYLSDANCEICYFITSDITPEERFALLKKYDIEKDYTFYKPDDVLIRQCENIVRTSKFIKAECEKHSVPYYETAHQRKKIFEHLCQNHFLNVVE